MQIDFDFFDHQLRIATSESRVRTIALQPRSVADFYRAVMNALADLGLAVTINTKPYDAVR
ncbi:DUF5996 family protein [Nodosilinea sp. AN01ver1]|uniref:DUF5996 family protein n=1 Tax=Nodosilinea sp. AN01ver1 TaxID=3423362 RepID=UPI003D321560